MSASDHPDGPRVSLALQLARLTRHAEAAELTDESRSLIRAHLMAALGISQAEPDQERRPSGGSAAKAAPASAGPAPVQAPARASAAARDQAQIELRLRQLVDAEAPWTALEPLVIELWTARRTATSAARIVELAFLHATTPDLDRWLDRFGREAPAEFWSSVHPAVRSRLVTRICGSLPLQRLIHRDRDAAWLQPVERLLVFRMLAGAADTTAAHLYFRRFRREILDAGAGFGVQVGLPLAALLLAAGRIALDHGHDGEARNLLAQIAEGTAEREEALRVLLEAKAQQTRTGLSHYVEQLAAEPSAPLRVALLGTFLDATRGLGGFKDRNRPALNDILLRPLEWLPEDPEALAALSELLTANRDLETLVPNLLEVFRGSALIFRAPAVDLALWAGPADLGGATGRDRYWRGIALLHRYCATGPAAEPALWEAFEEIERARAELRQPVPFGWVELQRAAHAWVAKTHHIVEADRQQMLRHLRVVVDELAVTVDDISDYAAHATAQSPRRALTRLERVAADRGAPVLAWRLALHRAAASHLVNSDLDRLWRLANDRREPDLAWRAATVLAARGSLGPGVRHAWEISGEKRSVYPWLAPQLKDVTAALRDLPPEAARLAQATLVVGPRLPALLAALDSGAASARVVAPPADSVEAQVDRTLTSILWLPPLKRRYRYSFEAATGGGRLPAFMQVLPSNSWSILTLRLAERLGINAWAWRLSWLRDQVADLVPKLSHQGGLRFSPSKVARWLRELTPAQRSAWQDMVSLGRVLSDQEAAQTLACLVCRLALMIQPNHMQALSSLQAMRAPLPVLWDLEMFILSEAWTTQRKQLGLAIRVPVPTSLAKATSILATSAGSQPPADTVVLPLGRRPSSTGS